MKTLRNLVTLTGHLGKNPEIIEIGQGKKLAKMSLAVQDYQGKDAPSKASWFSLVAFDPIADYAAKNFSKGQQLTISGRLSARSWQDKEGKTRYQTEVVVGEFLNTPSTPKSKA